ncbi:MAG: hypothetical protein R3C27_02665 [Hyphomonadaceae bacterium]
MAEFERVVKIESSDKRHALEITRNASGQYRFSELSWVPSKDDVDRQVYGDGYWAFSHFSGLHESAQTAEADARQSLAWFKERGE